MKILFITNLPSPYRVDFFNELGKKIDLTVCYERESSSERDAKWINKNQNVHIKNCLYLQKILVLIEV